MSANATFTFSQRLFRLHRGVCTVGGLLRPLGLANAFEGRTIRDVLADLEHAVDQNQSLTREALAEIERGGFRELSGETLLALQEQLSIMLTRRGRVRSLLQQALAAVESEEER